MPAGYPASCAPTFTLSAAWLSPPQLDRLVRRLDEIYAEQAGEVVLFSWTSFLQDEAFDFLELSSPLDLSKMVVRRRRSSIMNSPAVKRLDPRAIQDIARHWPCVVVVVAHHSVLASLGCFSSILLLNESFPISYPPSDPQMLHMWPIGRWFVKSH